MRYCHPDKLDPTCPLCKRCSVDPKFKEAMDQIGKATQTHVKQVTVSSLKSVVKSLPCIHLGEPNGNTVSCPSCRGTVQLKLFNCKIHGSTTLVKSISGIYCCVTCPDKVVLSDLDNLAGL